MRQKIPLPGMRTIKTTVAVMLSLAIFLPLEALGTAEGTRFIDQLGPFYACIASIVCMQSSVGATWKQGVSRLLGTLIGGLLGLLCVSVTTYWGHPVVLVLVCGVGTLACIYLCNVLNRPSACAISAIVCCSIMLSHSGQERYFYTVARMLETAVGILVAVLNQVLIRSGREEQAMMTTLAGLIVVLLMIVQQIDLLFTTVKNTFHL